VNKNIVFLAKLPDTLMSWLSLQIFREKPSLIIFTLHGLFQNEKEMLLNHVDPQLGITLHHFEQFIRYFLQSDYQFISPIDLNNGLDPEKYYIMLTFDDGYYNNTYALKYLKKYQIPASFFISMDHILNQKCFWWDVHYRRRKQQGFSTSQILIEQDQLKSLSNASIEKKLISWFGKDAFHSFGNIDRPFSIEELKSFAAEPLVHIGNHTKDHSILTNLTEQEIKNQIVITQDFLKEITGGYPIMISYPNGNYSEKIISISNKAGLKIAFTTDERKNYMPFQNISSTKLLHRFDLTENDIILRQCMLSRSDIVLYRLLIKLIKRKY
jgi:peptidoglycan/xylan/chitin deacetylase (PgdA/CDA1 family)